LDLAVVTLMVAVIPSIASLQVAEVALNHNLQHLAKSLVVPSSYPQVVLIMDDCDVSRTLPYCVTMMANKVHHPDQLVVYATVWNLKSSAWDDP
jgi:hypothetical protein